MRTVLLLSINWGSGQTQTEFFPSLDAAQSRLDELESDSSWAEWRHIMLFGPPTQ